MITEKLYDKDAYMAEFTAKVISCRRCDGGYKTVLDRTAFFPEGGGQHSDRGMLDDAAVTDVQIEDDEIYHYTDKAFCAGQTVGGRLDFRRRHSFMQNHSGEHIVSGIVKKKYGFDNVGFHLSEDFATLDLSGILSRQQLDAVEDEANRIVWENRPVRAFYPPESELAAIDYRSKKELSGRVRIVEIEGADVCACCAPHVKRTGEIGIIKLLDTERMRSGMRIILKCGVFALRDYRSKYLNVSEISCALSAGQDECAAAVGALAAKAEGIAARNCALKRRIAELMIKTCGRETACVFEDELDVKEMQLLCDGLHKTYGGVRAVFSAEDGGFKFAICADPAVLQNFFAEFKNAFPTRGGGRGGMVQGTVKACRCDIEKFFTEALKGDKS